MKLRLNSRARDTREQERDSDTLLLRTRRIRRLRDGRLVPIKNAASARNAWPKKVWVTHSGGSRALLHAEFDMRSAVGKAYQARVEELVAHLGGSEMVTAPQRTLIDHASRLRLLALLAWDELTSGGAFQSGEPRPALDAYRRLASDEREVLRTLGLERRAKTVPDLDAYLRNKSDRKRLPFKGRVLDPEEN